MVRRTAYVLMTMLVVAGAVRTSVAAGFLEWVIGPNAGAAGADEPATQLDTTAFACLRCHNGERATQVSPKNLGAPLRGWNPRSQDHPIGMTYATYAAQHTDDYRARGALDPGILLVDGKVSCVSCHRLTRRAAPESPEPVAIAFSSKGEDRKSVV